MKTHIPDKIIYKKEDLEPITYKNNNSALDIIIHTMEDSEYKKAFIMFRDPSSYRDRECYLYKDEGIAGLYFDDIKGLCWLSYFAVLERGRHKGLGSFLLSTMLKRAREKNMDRILIETYSTLIYMDAIQLYRK